MLKRLLTDRVATLLAVTLAAVLVIGALAPGFLSARTAVSIWSNALVLLCVALGLLPVLLMRQVDVSGGSVLGLSAVVLGLALEAGVPLAGAIVMALGTGMAAGLLNGLLVTGLGVPAIVATLGTLGLFRGIMLIATLLSLALSLVRMRGMVKLLDVPQPYLWSGILLFCVIGTYATSNSLSTVVTMLVFGVVGVLLKRMQVPAGPVVLGLLLGPLAEENLARTLAILPTKPFFEVVSPIAIALLALAVLSIVMPAIRAARKPRTQRAAFADSVLDTESVQQISHAREELSADPGLLTSTVRSITKKKNSKEKK